jgi:hypothetical protein
VTDKLKRMGLDPGFAYMYHYSILKNKRGRLVKMGYVKRDAPSAPRLHAKKKVKRFIVMTSDDDIVIKPTII